MTTNNNVSYVNYAFRLPAFLMTLMTLNIHSLINKYDHLDAFIRSFGTNKPKIFLITETWLKHNRFLHNISGYTVEFINRPGSVRGGGICLYIADNINYTVLHRDTLLNSFHLVVDLHDYDFRIGCVYRDPSNDYSAYITHLDSLMERHRNAIWMGDFNIDLLRPSAAKSAYETMLISNNMQIINKIDPTFATYYHTRSGTSILDHALTNLVGCEFNFYVTCVGFSDHDAVLISINRPPTVQNKSDRLVNRVDYNRLNTMIPSIINRASTVDGLISNMTVAINRCTSKRRAKEDDDHWITNDISLLFAERDWAKRKTKLFPQNQSFQDEYRELRNLATSVTRAAKQQFYQRKFETNMHDSRKTWQLLNDVLYGKIRSKPSITSILNDSGELLTQDDQISDYLTDYYTNIGPSLSQTIPGPANDPLINITQNSSTFTLRPVTISEVKNLIRGIRSNVAPGDDKITATLLKRHINSFAPLFTKLINNSFRTGSFDRSLKIAVACVLHKGGDKRRAENQRFVSVLSVVSKVWEGAYNKQLTQFLSDSNYLHSGQYGFISGSDTSTAAIDLVTFLQNALNSGKLAGSTFIDVAKAFDSVDHELLLKKLEKAGVIGPAHQLLKEYLNQRPCSVKVNDTKSDPKTMKAGVPQGSILSATLFLIFINDIFKLKLNGKSQLYADDVSIVYETTNTSEMNKQMNEDLACLFEWFISNKLVMNVKKTQFMLFHHKLKKVQADEMNVLVAGVRVQRVETFKYLGLHLDTHLNWHHHIDQIANKIASMIGAIHRACHVINNRTKIALYNAHVHSHLNYMAHIWGASDPTALRALETLQNKVIRSIFWREYNRPGQHTIDLYKAHNILPLSRLSIFSACVTTYKILSDQSHSTIHFHRNRDIHNYNTRRRSDIHLSQPRNRWGVANITFRGAKKFNSLPNEIRCQNSITKFKAALKRHLMTI